MKNSVQKLYLIDVTVLDDLEVEVNDNLNTFFLIFNFLKGFFKNNCKKILNSQLIFFLYICARSRMEKICLNGKKT